MAIDRLIKEISSLKPEEREKLFQELGVRALPKWLKNIELALHNSGEAGKENTKELVALKPLGFGMWKEREDLKDSTAWVRNMRRTEWQR